MSEPAELICLVWLYFNESDKLLIVECLSVIGLYHCFCLQNCPCKCVVSRCYSVCQGNIRPHFVCSSSVLAKIHFTQYLVCLHMCWRECKVISQPIHVVCVFLANQAILRCRSLKKVVILLNFLVGNFTLQMSLYKEIQNPAALNNSNKSSTGLCRQPRETGTVSFFIPHCNPLTYGCC